MVIAISIVILLNIIGLAWCYLLQSDKLTDLTYSLCFAIVSVWLWQQGRVTEQDTLMYLLVLLWSVRLGSYLFIRIHKMGDDKRFDKMRKQFSRIALFWLLQTVSIVIISAPLFLVEQLGTGSLLYPGLFLAIFGLMLETLADWQKYTFRTDPKNNGQFIHHGLWKWVQHPNYSGEIIFWSGISLITFQTDNPLTYLTFISPFWISLLLVRISGIPLLQKAAEKKYGEQSDFQRYKKETPKLFPLIY